MKEINKIFLVIICSIFILSACEDKNNGVGIVEAYVPIYITRAQGEIISQQNQQPIIEAGKVAKLGRYLFQVENEKGIHIIDVLNPAIPIKKSFISIPMCQELTLRGNYLYTNNLQDLVVLNITDINAVSVSSRLRNAFPTISPPYPSKKAVYFECADPTKGIVIGWELKQIENPKCKTL